MELFKLYSLLFVIGLISYSVLGLDEESAKERKCESLIGDDDVDLFWVVSVDRFYIPLWSKLSLYRTASDLLEKKISEINEEELKSGCVSCDVNLVFDGFNKSGIKYDVEYDYWNYKIEFKSSNNPHAKSGKHTLLKTDKDNGYAIGMTCWEDNEMSWFVFNTKTDLSNKHKDEILKEISKHGFKKEYAIHTPTDKIHCPHLKYKQTKEEL